MLSLSFIKHRRFWQQSGLKHHTSARFVVFRATLSGSSVFGQKLFVCLLRFVFASIETFRASVEMARFVWYIVYIVKMGEFPENIL